MTLTELLLNNLEIFELILTFNLITGCLSIFLYLFLLKIIYTNELKHQPNLEIFTFKKILKKHKGELLKVFFCNWLLILFFKNTYKDLLTKREKKL